VVVPGETGRRMRPHEGAALVRLRPVADEVAEAPDLVGRVGVDRREHGFERVQVRVDVRDDGRPHGYSLAARSPASVGTVAGTVDVTRSSNPHAPAARPVTTAARSFARATTPRSAGAARSSQPIVADPKVASWSRGM